MRTLNLGDLKARIPIVQGGMGGRHIAFWFGFGRSQRGRHRGDFRRWPWIGI